MQGESVLGWNGEDYGACRLKLLGTDNLRQALCQGCDRFVRLDQTDTLRTLLPVKEAYLPRTMHNRRQ